MATIVLNIPDAVLPRVVDALCAEGRRPEDSPISKGQFAKNMVIAYVREVVRTQEAMAARIVAEREATAAVARDVTIT